MQAYTIILIALGVILWFTWSASQFILSIPAGNWTVTDRFFDFYIGKANWLGKIVLSPIALAITGPALIIFAIYWIVTTIFVKKEYRK